MEEPSGLNSLVKLPVDTSHKVKVVMKPLPLFSLETSDSELNNGLLKNSSNHADKSKLLELL
jgi:hypothetical protein